MRARSAFTLTEVIITAAIMAIVAALIMPSLMGYYNARRAIQTADTLDSLALALNNPVWMNGYPGFLQYMGAYPQQLHALTDSITTADKQCNGVAYSATQVTLWKLRDSLPLGPLAFTFLNIIPGQGVSTPLGWIRDSVIKGTSATGTAGWVELHMDSISLADAERLDSAVDRTAVGSATGLLRYANSPTTGFQLVRYLISAPLFRRKTKTPAVDSTTGCF